MESYCQCQCRCNPSHQPISSANRQINTKISGRLRGFGSSGSPKGQFCVFCNRVGRPCRPFSAQILPPIPNPAGFDLRISSRGKNRLESFDELLLQTVVMTATGGYLQSKGSRERAKTDGWAAFDQKQRRSRGGTTKAELDPFPPLQPPSSTSPADGGLSGAAMGKNLLKQKKTASSAVRCEDIFFESRNSGVRSRALEKSFAAAVQSFTNQPAVADSLGNTSGVDQSITSLPVRDADDELLGMTPQRERKQVALEKLKVLQSWADDSLIEDVLMAVDYDHQQASSSLASMDATNLLGSLDLSAEDGAVEDSPSQEKFGQNRYTSFKHRGLEDADETNMIQHLPTAPPELEWEKDDIYLKYRKNALRMLRAGSRHSRIAENAFLRGDHHTARLMSMKAREEHLAADKLNAKAAVEIFQIRNKKFQNHFWKLDLHGLHASEAVYALESRLQMIEHDMSSNTSDLSIRRVDEKGSDNPSSSHELCIKSSRTGQMTDEDRQKQFPGALPLHTWRQPELQVITGTGVHSQGGATLPMAIKSFLIDKGLIFWKKGISLMPGNS